MFTALFCEADLKTNRLTQRLAELFCDACCDRARRQTARLSMPNLTCQTTASKHGKLGQLRGFARACFPCNNDDLMLTDRFDQGFGFGSDRQIIVKFICQIMWDGIDGICFLL